METLQRQDSELLLREAVRLHQEGKAQQAEVFYRSVMAQSPQHADAAHLLAMLFLQQAKWKDAIIWARKAVSLKPEARFYRLTLARSLVANREFAQALPHLNEFIQQDSDHADACLLMAMVQQHLGLLDTAIIYAARAVSINDAFPQGLQLLAELYNVTGNVTQASSTYNKLGIVLMSQREHMRAQRAFLRALAFKPTDATVHTHLGNCYYELGSLEKALMHIERAIHLAPELCEAHYNHGRVLKDLSRIDKARQAYQHALALNPDMVEAINNLGQLEQSQGDYRQSLAYYERAIALKPSDAFAHLNRAVSLLGLGEFSEAWPEYEWRVASEVGQDYIADPRDLTRLMPRPSQWLTRLREGQKVLIVHDQGLGDELFFLRFAPMLRAKGVHISYLAGEKVSPLLKRSQAIDQIVHRDSLPTQVDHIFAISDIPLVAQHTDESDLPPPLTLSPLPHRIENIKQRLTTSALPPLLTVTWRAGVHKKNGGKETLYKSIEPAELGAALRDWPGTIIIVQRHATVDEMASFTAACGRPVVDMSALNDDLEDMLALLSLVDEYIGVSNTNMHLRAAVNKPAQVLVPHPAEWRWLATGDVSPWFPHFRVYRQDKYLHWQDALDRLKTQVKAF